ncbi:MAG: hypothetical protein LAT63_02735 [Marinobacter sp.]|nr:hypothetical protein [Marinobacter sp.]
MTLKSTFYSTLAFALLLGFILIVQLHRYGVAVDLARHDSLTAWAGHDDLRQAQVQRYFEHCIASHRNEDNNRRSDDIRNLHQCAREYGSEEIASLVRNAPATVSVPVPLRWFW